MKKYKFAYIVEVSAELLTDDKELVQQLEEENDVKVTYDYLETDIGETIVECLEDLSSSMDIAVQPVKHGRWKGYITSAFYGCDDEGEPIYRDANFNVCSECGRKTVVKEKFCPNCGAKMDGDRDD